MTNSQKPKSKFVYQLLVCGVGISFLVFAAYSWQSTSSWKLSLSAVPTAKPYSYRVESILGDTDDEKLILFYTTIFGKDAGLGAWWVSNRTFDDCPYQCGMTNNRSLKDSSDAIVFHGEDDRESHLPLPHSVTKPDQVWIFFLLESPANAGWINFKKFNGHINWTMTYRHDSDIQWPYGRVVPRTTSSADISFQNKTKLAAAMISNCDPQSGRQKLIQNLRKYVPVDYYGKCGNLTCNRTQNCYQDLGSKYKFWLSFENSLCDDYVTEKFFKPLEYGAVPVVYGGANYSGLFPKKSFINALEFKTVKELADYLLYLDGNQTEYLKYFDWRKKFEVKNSVAATYCDLCTKLHVINFSRTRKYYKDVNSWVRKSSYNNGPACTKSQNMP